MVDAIGIDCGTYKTVLGCVKQRGKYKFLNLQLKSIVVKYSALIQLNHSSLQYFSELVDKFLF